jgi:hypothetical protein
MGIRGLSRVGLEMVLCIEEDPFGVLGHCGQHALYTVIRTTALKECKNNSTCPGAIDLLIETH